MSVHTLPEPEDPHDIFLRWFSEVPDDLKMYKTAFNLATADANGIPNARTVVMREPRHKDENGGNGILWISSEHGAKERELLSHNGAASGTFLWCAPNYFRQIRIRGTVSKTSAEISQKYFDRLPKQFRIGTLCCRQSEEVPNMEDLEKKYNETEAKYKDTDSIPRPDFYHAYQLVPHFYEFYEAGDILIRTTREAYSRTSAGAWTKALLAP